MHSTFILLGRDHLLRGRGPVQLFNQILFTVADFPVIAISFLLLCTKHGPHFASVVFGGDDDLLAEPLSAVRPMQASLILCGITMYFVKVMFWTWNYSHSNTCGIGTVLFVAFGYHLFVVVSICLAVYKVNQEPAVGEIVVGTVVFVTALVHEILADRELFEFKRQKSNNKKAAKGAGAGAVVLDYGYHAMCRHPNYFFNTFPFPCVALMSGSWTVCAMWATIQLFWVHTQSGPALEQHMATNYGVAWVRYCQSTPFFCPASVADLVNTLSFHHYVGVGVGATTKTNGFGKKNNAKVY